MKITVKEVVSYKGHNVKANGNIDVTFSAMYSELTNSMKVLQLLNNDVKITVKLAGSKPVTLGSFNVKSVSFNGDGESTIKFVSLMDFVEIVNLNAIIAQENFQIKFEADVEIEEEQSEDV